jgi:NitT/TauT family transport system ATP-binding protein
MSEKKLIIENVSKVFPVGKEGLHAPALQNFNLEVNEGEFVCVVGPSGCGKTTLLKIVAGLETASTGAVMLNGKKVEAPGPERGLVFQDFALYPWRNVRENVEFGPEMRKVADAERTEIAGKYINLVGLAGDEHKYPAQLSGGMKQRVAIARALANEPDILLMDEPFGSLDAQTRLVMQNELLRIWNEDRKAVIFVTHSVEEAVYLAERVVVMTSSPGTVKEIYPIALSYPRYRADHGFISLREKITASIADEVKDSLR